MDKKLILLFTEFLRSAAPAFCRLQRNNKLFNNNNNNNIGANKNNYNKHTLISCLSCHEVVLRSTVKLRALNLEALWSWKVGLSFDRFPPGKEASLTIG
jgi:hypothetical protein